jgi:hypothetical protein
VVHRTAFPGSSPGIPKQPHWVGCPVEGPGPVVLSRPGALIFQLDILRPPAQPADYQRVQAVAGPSPLPGGAFFHRKTP